jgi:hypothetical protein
MGFEYSIHKEYQRLQYPHKNTYEIHMDFIQDSLGDDPIQEAIHIMFKSLWGSEN